MLRSLVGRNTIKLKTHIEKLRPVSELAASCVKEEKVAGEGLQFHVGVIDKQRQFHEQQSWVEDRSSEWHLVSGWSFIQDLITFKNSDGICDRGISVATVH